MVFPHMFRMENTETKTTSSQYGEFYEKREQAHVKLEPETLQLLKYVDDVRNTYIDELREAVAIPSVSGTFKHRDDVSKMINYVEGWFKKLKVKYENFDIGWQKIDGLCCKLPTVLLGSLPKARGKKMLCLYCNIDVTSPEGEAWSTDPWTLTEQHKVLYGKGVSHGKGPLVSWFLAIHAYKKNKIPLPVNIKFIIDPMNEHNSEGLEDLLKKVKPKFLLDIDHVVYTGSEWLGQKYPCIVYGTAGTCRFEITVEQKSDSDPKEDMDKLFNTIVNEDNKILIPSFYDSVEQTSPAEEHIYDQIDFNFDEIRPTLPPNKAHWDKVQMLMSFWRIPDIVVGEDQVCTCEDKKDTTKTLKRCFTIKIVPKQTPEIVAEQVISHVYDTCLALNCSNKVTCEIVYGARPWLEDFRKPSYEALRRANVQVYHEEPNLIREDHEIPVLLTLLRVIEKDTILLTLANGNTNAHGGDEHIAIRNYIEGIKVLMAFLRQLSYY